MGSLTFLIAMNLPCLNVRFFSEEKRELFSNRTHLAGGPLNGLHCVWGLYNTLCGVNEHKPWAIWSFVWGKETSCGKGSEIDSDGLESVFECSLATRS